MFRCLKTGLGGISPDECDILENYVIVWDIRGGMWLREGDWTASPDGYGREMTETAPHGCGRSMVSGGGYVCCWSPCIRG